VLHVSESIINVISDIISQVFEDILKRLTNVHFQLVNNQPVDGIFEIVIVVLIPFYISILIIIDAVDFECPKRSIIIITIPRAEWIKSDKFAIQIVSVVLVK